MLINLKVTQPLDKIIGGKKLSINFQGKSIKDLIYHLCNNYPDLRNEFFDKNGNWEYNYNIFLNDVMVPLSRIEKQELKDSDEVFILMSAAGG